MSDEAPPKDVSDLLQASEQEQVLAHWSKLSATERDELTAQITELHDAVNFKTLRATLAKALSACAEQPSSKIEPPQSAWVGFADGTDVEAEKRWEQLGLELASKGACAACVLAGGMGTRLGTSFPKGMLGARETYVEFLQSGKSLFQLHCERIIYVQRMTQERFSLAEAPTVWFLVMTGEATHKAIVDFFQRHTFFGLREDQVIFFQQGMMPCLSEDGTVLMETPGRIAVSPDGNAGIYAALRRCGVLEKLKAAGVQWVQTFSVDNVLVRVADPVWYGYCLESGADVVVKTIPKRNWAEAVGVVNLRDGLPSVIEYSEIGEERAKETDATSGELKFNAANICLQAYSLDFLCGPAQDFPTVWHVARKQIPVVDGTAPGIKLEGFIFDVFAVAQNFRMLQVSRAAEFSAIKNSSESGKPDTPQTALVSLSRLHRRWLREAGASLPADEEQGDVPLCEISPLVSYRGEGLEERAKTVDATSTSILVE